MTPVVLKTLRALCIVLFWGALFVAFRPYVVRLFPAFDFSKNVIAAAGAILALSILATGILSMRTSLGQSPRPGRSLFLLSLSLLGVLPFSFLHDAFGSSSVDSVLFTFAENKTGQILEIGLNDFSSTIAKHVSVFACLLVTGFVLLNLSAKTGRAIAMASMTGILISPITDYTYHLFFPSRYHAAITAEDIVAPEILSEPRQNLNLVVVYLESIERTYRGIGETVNDFKPLARIEDNGVSFHNVEQVSGTSFTAGGMVASQCGVPIVPNGLLNPRKKIHESLERIPDFKTFLPNVTCLGDILAARNYNATYINGSKLSIFSKGDLFRSHGFQRVLGLESYPNWENEPRTNIWGMNDDLLFERVTEELKHLASQSEPFILTTLTISTHGPDGYLDPDCQKNPEDQSGIGAAIRCTGNHVERLLEEIDDLGISDKTLVLLLSDHLAARNTLWHRLKPLKEHRRNYAVILGTGEAVRTMKQGSMLDLYPTILEAMGYVLKDGRANLGRSLLSTEPTLSETFGREFLNRAIHGNPFLQSALWSDRAPVE